MDLATTGPYPPSQWYSTWGDNRQDEWWNPGLNPMTTNLQCPCCLQWTIPRLPWPSSNFFSDGLSWQGLPPPALLSPPTSSLTTSPPSSIVELLAPPTNPFQSTPTGGTGPGNAALFDAQLQSLSNHSTMLDSLTEDIFFSSRATDIVKTPNPARASTRTSRSRSASSRTPTPGPVPEPSSEESDFPTSQDEELAIRSLSEKDRFVVNLKRQNKEWSEIIKEYAERWGPTTSSTLGMRLTRLKQRNPVIRNMFPEKRGRKQNGIGVRNKRKSNK